MNNSRLLEIRLFNQLLSTHELKTPLEIVSWLGAVQSQALEMAKWAIGVRLGDKTIKDIEEALNSGQIIRTHILRPTWHFVSAEDIHWMYDLSNPRLRPIYQYYCKQTGADESAVIKAVPMIENILEGERHLTKEEIGAELRDRGVAANDLILRMAINYAEMEGLIVNGKLRGSKQTFTLLEEFAPRKTTLTNEESLERLARKYFTSHGPATIQDFAWWSGLSLTECRNGLGAIKDDFICEKVSGREFWMKNDIKSVASKTDSTLLLPPFDEFVVSYKDRSEIINAENHSKVMSKTGVFAPTVMLNGEIVGSWKKIAKKGVHKVELSFFDDSLKNKLDLFMPEIERVEKFYTSSTTGEKA